MWERHKNKKKFIERTQNAPTPLRELNIVYNTFKSPVEIEEPAIDKYSFLYNVNNDRSSMFYGGLQDDKHQRPLQKHYSADGSMEIKRNIQTGEVEFITYIGGDAYSAPLVLKSDGTTQEYLFLHRDYQGSILAITNEQGTLIEKRQFDAWGQLVKVQDQYGNVLDKMQILDRGYTGHEHLQSIGIIHMNGRLYDAKLHRFLQPDNFVQDPYNTQNFNRYGYVLNNPLKYTDPSGEYKSNPPGLGPENPGGGYGSFDGGGVNYRISIDFGDPDVKEFFNRISDGLKSFNGWIDNNLRSIGDYFKGTTITPPTKTPQIDYSKITQNVGAPLTGQPVFQMPIQYTTSGIKMTSFDNYNTSTNYPVQSSTRDIYRGGNIFLKTYSHFKYGNNATLTVSTSSLNFKNVRYGDLEYNSRTNTYGLDLYKVDPLNETALALGKISLVRVGIDRYRINPDKYDFNIEWRNGFTKRNIATFGANILHYGPDPIIPLLFGGSFWINFQGVITIKP